MQDLIARLALDCGLDETQTHAVVGAILGTIEEELDARIGLEASRSFSAEIPELTTWRVDALRLLGRAGRSTHGTPKFRDVLDADGRGGDDPDGWRRMVASMLDALRPGGANDVGCVLSHVDAFLRRRLSPVLYAQVRDVTSVLGDTGAKPGRPPQAPPPM